MNCSIVVVTRKQFNLEVSFASPNHPYISSSRCLAAGLTGSRLALLRKPLT
jgi:hypothetical protein